MKFEPQFEGVTLVLIGSFNPGIFHPAWLAHMGLIRKGEATAAHIQVISTEYSNFTAEWVTLQVQPDRFQISTTNPARYEELRDLSLSILKILEHTPVTVIGLQYHCHCPTESENVWHSFGHLLAPKDVWADVMQAPGLKSMTMQGTRKDKHNGCLLVKVEPSQRLDQGLYLFAIDEVGFDGAGKVDGMGAQKAFEFLKQNWDGSLKESIKMVTNLIAKV